MDKKSSADTPGIKVQIASAYTDQFSAGQLQAVAKATLLHEGRSGLITLVITDDKNIQALNRDFLGQDAPTDVLAFAAQEEAGPFVAAPEAAEYLGDVIISYPRALEQAEQLGHPAGEEVDLLVVHGILHLLGYDHATPDDKAIMWARQEAILQQLHAS